MRVLEMPEHGPEPRQRREDPFLIADVVRRDRRSRPTALAVQEQDALQIWPGDANELLVSRAPALNASTASPPDAVEP